MQVCCWRKRGARAVRRGRFSAVAQHAARGTQAQPHRYNAVVAVLELGLCDCAGGVSFFVHACSPGTPGARRLRSPAGGQGAPGSRQPRAWQKAKINDRLGDGRGRLLRSEHQSKHLCQRGRRAGVSAGRRRRAPCAASHRLLLFPVSWCFRACSLPRGVDQPVPHCKTQDHGDSELGRKGPCAGAQECCVAGRRDRVCVSPAPRCVDCAPSCARRPPLPARICLRLAGCAVSRAGVCAAHARGGRPLIPPGGDIPCGL